MVEGTKCVLEAKISAQDVISVKWFHDEQQITASDRVQSVAKGAKQRLVLNRTHESDQGRYKLLVGRAETTCTLTVHRKKTCSNPSKTLLKPFTTHLKPVLILFKPVLI